MERFLLHKIHYHIKKERSKYSKPPEIKTKKKQGFIHNCQLCNGSCMIGQIKLIFKNIFRVYFELVRSVFLDHLGLEYFWLQKTPQYAFNIYVDFFKTRQ